MNRRALRQWREWRDRLFPERQIIFRSRGDVRYIALSGGTQALLALGVLGLASWVGYASINVFYRDALLASRDRRIAELSLAYDKLAGDFQRSQDNFLVASRDLEERYRKLHEMASKQAAAPEAPKQAEKAAPKAAVEARQPEPKPAPEARPAEPKVAAIVPLSPAPASPAPASPAPAPEAAKPVAAEPPKADTRTDTRSVEDLEAMMRAARQKPAAQPAPKPGEIEARLLSLRGRQREVVDDLNQRTEAGVTAMERALRSAGLNVDTMLRRHAEARAEVGVGGPFRAMAELSGQAVASASNPPEAAALSPPSPAADPIERDVARLEGRLGRWGDLMALAQRLPLALPMNRDEAEVSSGFGRRVDPFTRQMAFHAGLDLIGPRQSAVLATAPGIVVFSGRKGPYGRAVEIDHGLGLRTRYAHLSAINVQVGDAVTWGKRIGAMGSTGRSTGQHLHYEILLDDEPVDPSKFIEAGYHVFKQQEEPGISRQ